MRENTTVCLLNAEELDTYDWISASSGSRICSDDNNCYMESGSRNHITKVLENGLHLSSDHSYVFIDYLLFTLIIPDLLILPNFSIFMI